MPDDQLDPENAIPEYTQLTQVQVPLEDAADAFTMRDSSGRIPIIVIPKHLNRIRNEIILAALFVLAFGTVGGIFINNTTMIAIAVPIGFVLLLLGVYRSFVVRIPEGVSALLMRGGRYVKTVGAGTHFVPPWVVISHLVTRREIPFDVPIVQAPTKDNVRANIDTLMTFRITDPYQFVYNISAGDFDQVFQAVCQDSLRLVVRNYEAIQVIDLTRNDLDEVVANLSADVEVYGVEITKINVTYAQPPNDFMFSLEQRQLAIIQQEEQEQKQALAKRRQRDEEDLAQQRVIAQVDRDRETLKAEYQKEEARRRVVELEAETEDLRLSKMQERMQKYPEAVQFDVETRELDIAQALAGNSRAILQIGSASDIVRSLLVRESVQEVVNDKHQAKAEDVFKPAPESATGNETVEDK
jgi:regulator of protease activity HflC (stomatin/prohibitin superfamily)